MPKTPHDLAELARTLLPPGVRVVAMAAGSRGRMRFRLEMPPGVDPFVAQAALQAVPDHACEGTGFAAGPARGRIVDRDAPFRPPESD